MKLRSVVPLPVLVGVLRGLGPQIPPEPPRSDWTLREPVAQALKAGDRVGALKALATLMAHRSNYDPAADERFVAAFGQDPGFADLVKRHHLANPVRLGGTVAFMCGIRTWWGRAWPTTPRTGAITWDPCRVAGFCG